MKSLLLTEHEDQILRMFLLMTTNYRRGEQESCARLATETDEDGSLTFPKMANNAQWWQGCIDTIDAITEKMGVRGGGLPLEVAEAGMCGRYRNMLDDVKAGFAKSTIMQERAFYDGMLQMLNLLGGHCKVSEYGSHTISFADELMQPKTTIDPADSQQSQACALNYGASSEDIKSAQLVRQESYKQIKQELIDMSVLQIKDGKTIFVAENLGDIDLDVANSRNRIIRYIRSTCA